MDAATRARLLGLFVEEAREGLAELEQLTERLGDDAEALGDFARIAHGLKGAANSLELSRTGAAFHSLEAQVLALKALPVAERTASAGALRQSVHRVSARVDHMAVAPDEAWHDEGIEAPAPAEKIVVAQPAAPTAPSTAERSAARSGDRINVPLSLLDEALALASSLARAVAELEDRGGGAVTSARGMLTGPAERLERLLTDIRLVPVEEAIDGFEAEVSALCTRLGKRAALHIEGRDVRADRRSLETARNLIRHLLRNALDHGLEPPRVRESAGKPSVGRITVGFSLAESRLQVVVDDDGAGFDVGAIRNQLGRESVAQLSDADVIHRFANEGGSTREVTTDVSGRGLGLSAVAGLVRAAGGSFQISSRQGEGSTVRFTLPLQVYTADVLTVSCSGEMYALPLSAIVRTVSLGRSRAHVQQSPAGLTLAVDEGILPLYRLEQAWGGAHAPGRFALVVRVEGAEAAFEVDELGASERVVPTAVPPLVGPGRLVTGVTLLTDGTHVQVLDAAQLLSRVRTARAQPIEARPAAPSPPVVSRKIEVLLAEDSLATREVLRVLLEEEGFIVRLAADGEEAWARISERLPDVVVTDANMPRRDGMWLTRTVRENATTAKLPVILLTSQGDAETRANASAAGVNAHLLKQSFNAGVLRDTLRSLGVNVSVDGH